VDELAVRANRRFIIGDDLAVAKEFGDAIVLLLLRPANRPRRQAHYETYANTHHYDGETNAQHLGSPFYVVSLHPVMEAASGDWKEGGKNLL
jgi:hypothetical protein